MHGPPVSQAGASNPIPRPPTDDKGFKLTKETKLSDLCGTKLMVMREWVAPTLLHTLRSLLPLPANPRPTCHPPVTPSASARVPHATA